MIEVREQVTNRLIKPLDVAPVAGDMHTVGLRLIVLHEFLRRVVGIMRQHRGIPDKEGLLGVLASIDEVIDRLHRLPANIEPLVAVPRTFGHALVKATAREVPLPPLTGLQARVPVCPEELGQRRPALQPLVHLLAAILKEFSACGRPPCYPWLLWWVIPSNQMLMRIVAGDQRGKARTTKAAGHIAPGVDEALGSQPVEGWCPQLLMAKKGVVPPMLIVREDKDHVGPALFGCPEANGGQQRRHNKGHKPEGPAELATQTDLSRIKRCNHVLKYSSRKAPGVPCKQRTNTAFILHRRSRRCGPPA